MYAMRRGVATMGTKSSLSARSTKRQPAAAPKLRLLLHFMCSIASTPQWHWLCIHFCANSRFIKRRLVTAAPTWSPKRNHSMQRFSVVYHSHRSKAERHGLLSDIRAVVGSRDSQDVVARQQVPTLVGRIWQDHESTIIMGAINTNKFVIHSKLYRVITVWALRQRQF